ncbi:8-oxo-dGDP phosphatase NUDT18 isoform X3 [Eurytemora carolleeae]|uniref:8-oxo-dGDP phosphatase NUDT18 isoform X3 n=1 Tax=Eurytemora carolleeae TaxID=1294199 RepID=UPI000C79409A|nr:8-oxo-dGDP phosphatase NUDT18 isoform X3 [Eurytemora carolleeae]|eukprot:XP_023339477.1 8-oxo-dGDP phosphatase NUDT18-like isoform X3 [Eurytemora affinis]
MDGIQEQLRLLMDGRPYEEQHDFCDFSLADQYEAVAAKGVAPAAPVDFEPRVQKSIVYIVAAVIFNENGEVLMMQEAKSSCAGQWYLPAGKMEAGEDITEAAAREVLEETGLEFQCTTLLLVESASGSWYRFVVTGTVTGGRLKTPADADSESLQAKWVDDLSIMSLRCNDILPHIERGKLYNSMLTRSLPEPWHAPLLPALRPHNKLLLRTVILIRKKTNNRMNVLVSEKTEAHLPVCDINPMRSIHSTLKKFLTEIFGADIPQHKLHGLLSLEHSGLSCYYRS